MQDRVGEFEAMLGVSGTAERTFSGLGILAKLAAGKVCRDRMTALGRALGELPGVEAG